MLGKEAALEDDQIGRRKSRPRHSATPLPLSFQDAVRITKGLGLRYLWIDSLCIIQDDAADWEEQAAQMADVYRSAYLTVAASAAADSSVGVFNRQPRATGRLLNLRGVQMFARFGEMGVKEDLELKATHEAYDATLTPELRNIPAKANRPIDEPESYKFPEYEGIRARAVQPLQTRAWAFQERLLSTRIVHYTANEMIFECRECQVCECSHKPRQPPLSMLSFAHRDRPVPPSAPVQVGPDTRDKPPVNDTDRSDATFIIRREWFQVVEYYSRLGLTVRTDTLPALSALARLFSTAAAVEPRSVPLGSYHAGLWQSHFPENLLWYREKVPAKGPLHAPAPAGEDYCAPTWSWAFYSASEGAIKYWPLRLTRYSTDTEVDHTDRDLQVFSSVHNDPRIRILEVECSPKGPDEFGQVSRGFLRLRAYVVPRPAPSLSPVLSGILPERPYFQILEGNLVHHDDQQTTSVHLFSRESNVMQVSEMLDHHEIDGNSTAHGNQRRRYYYLFIQSQVRKHHHDKTMPHWACSTGLILGEVEPGSWDTLERVGMFEGNWGHGEPYVFPRWPVQTALYTPVAAGGEDMVITIV